MKTDDSEVLARIEAQLIALDKKLEALMMRPSHTPRDRDDHQKGKMMHKAVCSECGQPCDIPFKPTNGRPVFCSECFAKQQGEGHSESRFDKRPHGFKKFGGGSPKPFHKKKAGFQKRKKYDI